MKHSEAFLNQIKTHDSLPHVLVNLIPDLTRKGSSYKAKVPWRQDNHPSLGVFRNSDGVWFYKDFAQDDSGDVIALVQRVTGQDFSQAVQWLAGQLGIAMPTDSHRKEPAEKTQLASAESRLKVLSQVYENAKLLEGTVAADYLEKRGLLNAARDLGVRGYDPGEPQSVLTDAYALGLTTLAKWVREKHGFLVYPAAAKDRMVVHRCRLLMNGAEARHYGFHGNHWTPLHAKELGLPGTWPTFPENLPNEIILTEGETDALAVHTLVKGVTVFAILGTGGLSDESKEFQQVIQQKPLVILAFQRDTPSAKKAQKLLDQFARYGINCRPVVPAGGASDWAELIGWDGGSAESIDVLSAPLGDCSLPRSFDALTRHIKDAEAGLIKSIPLPWKTLTWTFNGYGIPAKTIGLLASITGVGKTWLTYFLALFVAGHRMDVGLPVFVCNTEMDDAAIAARLLALVAGNKNVVTMADVDLVRELQFEYQKQIDQLPLEITPPDARSCDDVIDLLARKVDQFKFLVVDHIGDLSFSGKSWEALPNFTLALRDLARKSGATIMLVSHLKTGETGMDVLSYSKQMENVVDWSWSLQAFEPCTATISTDYGKVEEMINRTLTIRKNRFGHSGIRVAMNFDEEALSHNDLGRVIKLNHQKKGK